MPQAGTSRATMEPAELGLRERKKQRTRRALRMAAIRLVAERGLDGVSVDEIAAAAAISTRTFFNYFPTKDEAIVGLDPEDIREITEAVSARRADESRLEALREVMLQRAALVAPDRPTSGRSGLRSSGGIHT